MAAGDASAPSPDSVTIVLHGYFSSAFSGSRRSASLPHEAAATPRAALTQLGVPVSAVGLLVVGKERVAMDDPLPPGARLDVLPLMGGG